MMTTEKNIFRAGAAKAWVLPSLIVADLHLTSCNDKTCSLSIEGLNKLAMQAGPTHRPLTFREIFVARLFVVLLVFQLYSAFDLENRKAA